MAAAVLAPWIAAQLRAILPRPGHAWLLQGASGLGQYDLALGLAQGWLCDRPTPDGACGECDSCHQVAVRSHTDLCVLMPETAMLALEWPLAERAQAEIDDKKRKPSKEIRIDALRDAVEFAQRTSGRGRGKVVMVYPAERMNGITANALLKTLEEPPGAVRFVLATEAAHLLLPTIRSRCLGHALAWPAAGEAETWLRGQGVDATAAPALLRAAGGRPESALRLHNAGVDARRWGQLPQALARGDGSLLADWPASQVVDALQKLCHDLLAVRAGAAPRFFDVAELKVARPAAGPSQGGTAPSGGSEPRGAGSVGAIPSWERLADWSKSLVRAARTVEHPFQPGLQLEALVSEARGVLNSGR
jgi:DNA polymerase-3 subunit delta'